MRRRRPNPNGWSGGWASSSSKGFRGLSWYDEGGIFDSGYHLTGPAILGGVGKHFRVSSRLSVGLEVQLIAAWAKVPVAEGNATAPNVALHGMVGVGYRL